jgi:hypothetical protein
MVAKKEAHKKDDQPVVNDADQSVAVIADDPKPKAQKKVKTLPVEEREGHAVVSVDVPAHKAEVSVAHSGVPGVIAAAVEAWHKVKGDDDAEFAKCLAEFRQNLINHAEEVHRSGVVTEGDTVMAKFEAAVAKIFNEAAAKAA